VPVSAVLTRKRIDDKVFDRIDRAVVHGSTFAKNDLAMAAGIATLDVIKDGCRIARAAQLGERLQNSLKEIEGGYEFVQAVRGKGLMIGVEFGPPSSLRLKASWHLLETASKGLFCQLVTIPLFRDHKVLTQVAGRASHTIKLLPPLVITDEDCDLIEHAFDDVIAATQSSGAIWSLGKKLVGNALQARGQRLGRRVRLVRAAAASGCTPSRGLTVLESRQSRPSMQPRRL
jgi:ornithine--oxo-acid transaminase